MSDGDETFPESSGNAQGSASICGSPSSGNAGIHIGSLENAGGSYVNFMSRDDALLPGPSGDAGGPCDISQFCQSENAGVIGENSNFKLNDEGGAKNSNSSTHPIDNDAIPLGSLGNAGGWDKNSVFHGDVTFPESSGDAKRPVEICLSPPSGNARILLESVGNAGCSDVNSKSLDDALRPGSSGDAGGSAEISQSELNPDCEGGGENSNSSIDCIINDAKPLGSLWDVECIDKNTESHHSGNVESAGEKSKLSSDGEDVTESSKSDDDRSLFESSDKTFDSHHSANVDGTC